MAAISASNEKAEEDLNAAFREGAEWMRREILKDWTDYGVVEYFAEAISKIKIPEERVTSRG